MYVVGPAALVHGFIQQVFEKRGDIRIDDKRNWMREKYNLSDKEWTLLMTEMFVQGLLCVEGKKLFSASCPPKAAILEPPKK